MSMSVVHHVREKSQAKGSARTLLLNLAIYANDCCGVAWPADTTLYHDVNVSRQRIHALKNILEAMGELVIIERPGSPTCTSSPGRASPLAGRRPTPDVTTRTVPCGTLASRRGAPPSGRSISPPLRRGESDVSDPLVMPEWRVSDPPDQGSEMSDRGCQTSLTRKTTENHCENTSVPVTAMPIDPRSPLSILPKAEQANPF